MGEGTLFWTPPYLDRTNHDVWWFSVGFSPFRWDSEQKVMFFRWLNYKETTYCTGGSGSINRGTPKMDGLFHGKSIYKWMIFWGSPIYGNPHIFHCRWRRWICGGGDSHSTLAHPFVLPRAAAECETGEGGGLEVETGIRHCTLSFRWEWHWRYEQITSTSEAFAWDDHLGLLKWGVPTTEVEGCPD